MSILSLFSSSLAPCAAFFRLQYNIPVIQPGNLPAIASVVSNLCRRTNMANVACSESYGDVSLLSHGPRAHLEDNDTIGAGEHVNRP